MQVDLLENEPGKQGTKNGTAMPRASLSNGCSKCSRKLSRSDWRCRSSFLYVGFFSRRYSNRWSGFFSLDPVFVKVKPQEEAGIVTLDPPRQPIDASSLIPLEAFAYFCAAGPLRTSGLCFWQLS